MYKGKTTTLMIMDLTIMGLMFLILVSWTQMMINNIMKRNSKQLPHNNITKNLNLKVLQEMAGPLRLGSSISRTHNTL